jgi:fido (protein-threonine AMPylation protein)
MNDFLEFDQYIRQGEPNQQERAAIWRTAIGLQAVDGLQTSDYLKETALKHIEGEINIDEARQLIKTYYQSKATRETIDDDQQEADKASANITKILSSETLDFSTKGYIALHRRIFEGVFKHAGQVRDYDITKKEWVLDGATVLYGSATELRATLDYDFSEEKKFSYKGLSMDEIIHHLAIFISRLWQIHVFGEGNTRTTAVFFIKYLRSLGFDVTNDIFAENAWYFRNSLVRANYNDLKNGIHETTEYLELFLKNLLLNEDHLLHNRTLHISGTFKEMEKPDIGAAKPDIEKFKADIEELFQPKTTSHILKPREAYPGQSIFGRSDVINVIEIKPSRASDLLKDMVEHGIIEPVTGHGKGKYRFIKQQD